MTHLWKESESQNIGAPSIWLWGKYVAPVVHDLIETMHMFRSQTASPALKAFGCMIAMVIRTFFLAWREALGHARVQYHQNLRDTAPISREIPKTPRGLSIESSVNLRKIQGAIGENWSAATAPPVRTHQGKDNRWTDSRRVDAGKVMENPWQDALVSSKAIASQAPAAHEEIKGLDDLFDRPVTGLFLDTDKTAPVRKHKSNAGTKAGASHQRVLADYQYEISDETKTEAMKFNPADAHVCECQQAKVAASRQPVAQAQTNAVPVCAGEMGAAYPTEGAADWYSMTEGEAYQADAGVAAIDEDYEPCFEDFDAVIAGGGDTPGFTLAEVPTLVKNQPTPVPEEPVKIVAAVSAPPVQKSILSIEVPEPPQKSVPWFAEETEPAPPATPSPAAQKSSNIIPWFLQERKKQAPKVEAVKAEVPKPAPPAEAPKPSVKPDAPTCIVTQAPLNLDHELEEDLNAIEYMAQNNRMLSNSITNLVDSYFKQASQEEEPNFY